MHVLKSIGITGSRWGFSSHQQKAFHTFLKEHTAQVFCHGDCIGVDEAAAKEFSEAGSFVLAFPGEGPSRYRAHSKYNDFILPRKNNLVRNRDIVYASVLMIAFPYTIEENVRAGTWHTIRFTKKEEKPLIVFFPHGVIESYNYDYLEHLND